MMTDAAMRAQPDKPTMGVPVWPLTGPYEVEVRRWLYYPTGSNRGGEWVFLMRMCRLICRLWLTGAAIRKCELSFCGFVARR